MKNTSHEYKSFDTFAFEDAWDKKANRRSETEVTMSDGAVLFVSHFAVSKKDARKLAYFILHKTKQAPPQEPK